MPGARLYFAELQSGETLTPKRSHVKLPITEPYTIARRNDF